MIITITTNILNLIKYELYNFLLKKKVGINGQYYIIRFIIYIVWVATSLQLISHRCSSIYIFKEE